MERGQKQKILEELGGIPEDTYDELVGILITQVREKIPKMKEALNSNDFESLARMAHSLKGASGNLRIYAIQRATTSIDDAARGGKNKNDIGGNLKAIEDYLAELEKDFLD